MIHLKENWILSEYFHYQCHYLSQTLYWCLTRYIPHQGDHLRFFNERKHKNLVLFHKYISSSFLWQNKTDVKMAGEGKLVNYKTMSTVGKAIHKEKAVLSNDMITADTDKFYKGVLKTVTIYDRVFSENSKRLLAVKYFRKKISIKDVWKGFKYISGLHRCHKTFSLNIIKYYLIF